MNKKYLQRILVVVFGLAFVGSTGAVIIGSLLRREPAVANNPIAETADPLEQLQAQARGYEKVLAREPNNLNALISLFRIRRETGDLQGALIHLDKLIEIFPEDPRFVTVRQEIQQELESISTEPEDASSEPEN